MSASSPMKALSAQSSFRKAAIGATAGLAMLTMPFAAANDVQAQPPQQVAYASSAGSHYDSVADLAKDASNYSLRTGGIGVIVHYGPGNAISADQIGQGFVTGLKKRGEDAEYFVLSTPHAPGASLSFAVGDDYTPRFSVEDAVKNIDNIVSKNVTDKRMKNLLGLNQN
ncbi:MAG: hypothetical protein IT559_08715 [Alphaproteobacteria bacterium]|nr:hypothetical protein [Alphaproteobacteria bacterium]